MGTMAKISNIVHGSKPTMIMVIVQAAFGAVSVLYKLAANDGMNLKILVAYRFLFAAAFIGPVALYVERRRRPKLTWTVLFQAFLCGLVGGSMAQNLYAESIALISATFVAAIGNIIPAITFIFAISFRLEKLGWATPEGKAKVLGTLMSIGGAMILSFYKGLQINIWKTHLDILHKSQQHGGHVAEPHQGSGNHLLGVLLALGCCICFALWFILQAKMIERYPCPYSSNALVSVMGSIQGVVFALCIERDWSQWKLGWNIRFLTVAISGIVGSGIMFTFMAWCVRMRGPVFVSAFNPLGLVFVAIAGPFILDEKLQLGSILGAILIVCGLYVILWGKGKEMKMISSKLKEEKCLGESKPMEIVSITSSTQNNNST